MLKVKHERTCDCAVAGYRLHKDGKGVGSLLLGLYDDDGVLHHVGVASSMAAAAAREHARDAAAVPRARARRPSVARLGRGRDRGRRRERRGGRMPGGQNRWNANKDMSWEPLRIELVAEVAYEGLMNGRFRHNARFRRFRDDRDPSSCRYDQLEVVAPEELKAVFGA